MKSMSTYEIIQQMRSAIAAEVHKEAASIGEYKTIDSHTSVLQATLLALIYELGRQSPDTIRKLRQFGFFIFGELFIASTSASCVKESSKTPKFVFSKREAFLGVGALELPCRLFPWRQTDWKLRFLQITRESDASRVLVPDQSSAGHILYLSEEDVHFLANSWAEVDYDNSDLSQLIDDFRPNRIDLYERIEAFAVRGSDFRHHIGSITGRLSLALSHWLQYQISVGCDGCLFNLEQVAHHGNGVGVFWFALEENDPETILILSAFGQEFMQEIYNLELSAVLRAQWISSAGEITRENIIHHALGIVASQRAALARVEMIRAKGSGRDINGYLRDSKKYLANVKDDLESLRFRQDDCRTGVWRTNPIRLIALIKSFLTKQEKESCIFAYQSRGLKYGSPDGVLRSSPSKVCQISGPPDDLAAALFGFIRNAVEARMRVVDWDHDGLRQIANNASGLGLEVEMSATSPIAFVVVWADLHNLVIDVYDGGPGISEAIRRELFLRTLLEPGPSEKKEGGRGIKQSWLMIKSRYQGQIFGLKPSGWQVQIPTIPRSQRMGRRGRR